jgi:hypothetical protein
MMVRCYLIFLLLLGFYSARGQQVFSGKVTNASGEPVNGAILSVRNLDGSLVLAYGVSNESGVYRLRVNHNDATVLLEVSFLGYAKQSIAVDNKTSVYDFILQVSTEELKEVIVKSAPVYQVKDTINYDVGEFASSHDRVIGDVLRKLPGIETLADGQILYRGKPIQRYYINGLDLLEGKYRMANDNLPLDAVRKVQVIENDQPIKILDSLVFSDQASLNIQLKKLTTTGRAELGAGAEPFLHEVNITPMTFHRSFQAIFSFQSNNTGDAVYRQLRGFYEQANIEAGDLLQLQRALQPPFDERRWLDNSINLGSVNLLKKLQGEVELKASISYYNDFQKIGGDVQTTVFSPDQEIRLTESLDNRYSTDHLRGNVTFVKNTPQVYIENKSQFQREWEVGRGNLLNGPSEAVSQKHLADDFALDNRFAANTRLGSQLIQFGSNLQFSRNPESLHVTPGQFWEMLNEGEEYDELIQQLTQRNTLFDNHVGIVKGIKRFTISPVIGLLYQDQRLSSQLTTFQPSREDLTSPAFQNDIRWVDRKIYARVGTQYELPDLQVNFVFPVSLQRYTIERTDQQVANNRLITEPTLNITFEPHPYWALDGSIAYTDDFGSLDRLYNSYILTSYRNLQRFNGLIPESSGLLSRLSFHFKNPLKSFFANLNISQSVNDRNFIYQSRIDENGLTTLEMLEHASEGRSRSVGADLSKYLFALKTTVKAAGTMRFSQNDYILNDVKGLLKSENYEASLMASYNQLRFVSVVWDSRLSLFRSRTGGSDLDDVVLTEQDLQINLTPWQNHQLAVQAEYFRSHAASADSDQVFLNASYRLSFPKNKIDLELRCQNLLDKTFYRTFYHTAYSLIQNTYALRPRQVLVKIAFRL